MPFSPPEEVPNAVQSFRARYRTKNIGPRYSGPLHLAFTSLGSITVIVFAAMQVHAVDVLEWLTIPCTFLFANFAEYHGHRGPMHHPFKGMKLLFRRHTQEHHHFYTHEAMTYESSRDFKMVLFPPAMLIFFLGIIAGPVGTLCFLLITPNVGWLFVTVAMSYFLTYEWLHFAHHLPRESWIARLPLMGTLRRHHTQHHDKGLMGKWNFNITFPVCDWIYGTYHRGPRTAPERTSSRIADLRA